MDAHIVHNAAELLARSELEACTARILFQLGFSHANESTVDLLADLTRRYIQTMCSTLRWVSDHCGRTSVTLGDMEYTCRKMSIDVDELNAYMKQVRPYPPPRLLPRFPVARPAKVYKTKANYPSPDNKHEDFPPWVPSTCTDVHDQNDSKRDKPTTSSLSKFPPLPDFSSQSALSLGLCKLKKSHREEVPLYSRSYDTTRRQPSLEHLHGSRPPSRNVVSPAVFQPIKSEPAPPTLPSPKRIVSMTTQPMFKRKLGKRKSQEENINQSSSSTSVLGRMRTEQQASVLDLIQTPVRPASDSNLLPAATSTPVPPLHKHFTRMSHPSEPVLNVASDLLKDPASVIHAAVSGRSAPSTLPPAVEPIPATPASLYAPPREGEQPVRIIQMAILRHLLAQDKPLEAQLKLADQEILGVPAHKHFYASAEESSAPESEPVEPPVYQIIKEQASMPTNVLAPLKIRIGRIPHNNTSAEPSPVGSHITDTDDSDGNARMRRRHKKKKRKKKRRDSCLTENSEQPSPCEIQDDGSQIRMKIRLQPRNE